MIGMLTTLALLAAAAAIIAVTEDFGPYVVRNMVPVGLTLALLVWRLRGPEWRWRATPWRRLLGTLGFALPAIGLSLYLHLGLVFDWGGMGSRAKTPALLFRFLPYYTVGAGCIGFGIGWIIGRNLDRE